MAKAPTKFNEVASLSDAEKWTKLQEILPDVSRETFADLLYFESLVVKWQKSINLIANATLPELWQRHILDSAQIFPLRKHYTNWCDLGSGGGFPALVIAILLKHYNITINNTLGHINLVESNGKKCAFLRSVIAELDLPATVFQARIEESYRLFPQPEVITARALASLELLLTLGKPWFAQGSVAIFQKGRDYQKEIDLAHINWQFLLIKYQSKIDNQSIILEMSNIQAL